MGRVDVTATMRSVGIDLEWPPITKAYQIALAGKCRRQRLVRKDGDETT